MLKCKDNFWEFAVGLSVSTATESFLPLSFHILGVCGRCQSAEASFGRRGSFVFFGVERRQ